MRSLHLAKFSLEASLNQYKPILLGEESVQQQICNLLRLELTQTFNIFPDYISYNILGNLLIYIFSYCSESNLSNTYLAMWT